MPDQCATTTTTRTIMTASGIYAPGHLGELTQYMPFELVEDVLTQTRRVQRRLRLLPSRVGVYFVLALTLFPALGYARVWDKLVAGLPLHLRIRPSERALGEVRRRLGPLPFRMLFEVVSGSLAPPETPGVCYRRWRTVAFDGCSSIKAPDRPRLRTVLGKSRNQQGDAGYPALRLTALCETGTRGLLAAVFGSCSVGELASATALLGHLNPRMLLLADRGFDADTFLSSVSDTGAQYLVRLRSSRRPLIETVLSDGSYLTHLGGRPVRIIVATVTATCADGKKVSDSYQATTLLDPVNDPAGVLVRLYHERWEVESAFYALRHTLQDGRVLRSCDPAGLEQELWSSLIVYQLLRRAMTDAALGCPGTDPDRMSFTVALESARNQVTTASGIDGCEIDPIAPGTIGGAVLTAQMPPRRPRLSIRKVKCSTSRYAGKADGDRAMTSTNVVRLSIDIYDGHVAFPSAPTYTPAQDEQLTASRSRRKEQVIQLLQSMPARSWTAREIAHSLGLPKHSVIAGQLCQWALSGVLERTAPGAYILTHAWADPAHPGRAGHTARERTIALLQAHPGRSWKAREILHALDFPPSRHRSLVSELCRWVHQGVIERSGPGDYTHTQHAQKSPQLTSADSA
ncbi:IS4 family transposase [Streptomyces sp. NBC_01384]|uniref:IS4 family transposase n=1 Tax=unclassified Streptomyces TaxID=2593676 RepID=UPI00324414DE